MTKLELKLAEENPYNQGIMEETTPPQDCQEVGRHKKVGWAIHGQQCKYWKDISAALGVSP